MVDQNISASGNRVKRLTNEELKALTLDLQAVLEKHGAEMGVTSTINLMKVVEDESTTPTETEAVLEQETDSTTESSS